MAAPKVGFGKLGYWAFLLGIIIAVIVGLAVGGGVLNPAKNPDDQNTLNTVGAVLVLLGAVVGFLNIGDKDIPAFLIAALALMTTGAIGFANWGLETGEIGAFITRALGYLATFVAPAAIVVAVKKIYDLAKGA